jgi:hypothetical protein
MLPGVGRRTLLIRPAMTLQGCSAESCQTRGVRRAEEVGYRSDWRGVLAYLCSPELWRPVPFALFVAVSVAFTAGCVAQGAMAPRPALGIPVWAGVAAILFVRPTVRVWRLRRLSSASG